MIRAHRDAVRTLLTGVGLTVHLGRAAGPPPYVVLHPDAGSGDTTTTHGDTDRRAWLPVTHSVGVDVEQTQWVTEKVWGALLDVRPTVAGRQCTPLRNVSTVTVDRDTDGATTVYLARDVWGFVSYPA